MFQWRRCRCFQRFGDQCALGDRCPSDVSVGDVGVSVASDADVISGLMTSVSVTSVFSKLTLHIPSYHRNQIHLEQIRKIQKFSNIHLKTEAKRTSPKPSLVVPTWCRSSSGSGEEPWKVW